MIAGSALFLAMLERFPIVVWGGGALLGWIAGGSVAGRSDRRAVLLAKPPPKQLDIACGIAGAIVVVLARPLSGKIESRPAGTARGSLAGVASL